MQRVEAVGTAVEEAGLLVWQEPPQTSQPKLALEEQELLHWSQRWTSKPVVKSHA